MPRSITLTILLAFLPGCEAPTRVDVPATPRDVEPPFARAVPIRFVELHAPRHPECQGADGSPFRGPLGAAEHAWLDTEEVADIVSRLDPVYDGTDITFWLQSHDVYCTDTVATDDNSEFVFYPHHMVDGDVGVLYPHDERFDFPSDNLPRSRWLEKAYALYADPHAFTVLVHNDFVSGTDGSRLNPVPLPQHGFFPWTSPSLAFMFLSGLQWGPGWEFDTELTLAHEIGHALGNCHTLDADGYCLQSGSFPNGRSYEWQDIWDLVYADTPSGPVGFRSRDALLDWIDIEGEDELRLIDDKCNGDMDSSGRLTLRLDYDAAQAVSSLTQVTASDGGLMRLLQGLSFPLAHNGHAWQRNVMSYRYPGTWSQPACDDSTGVDPYDHLTARFSTSQIELMREQLSGSVALIEPVPYFMPYGTIPPGTASSFGSRFNLLGDDVTEDFVWYSNGEGPMTVNPGDGFPDRVAFRSSPARALQVPAGVKPAVIDLDHDGLDDLVYVDAADLTFAWSWLDDDGANHRVHRFNREATTIPMGIAGETEIVAADIDLRGGDDLVFLTPGEPRAAVMHLDDPCRDARECVGDVSSISVPDASHDVTLATAGNLDGSLGDDLLLTSHGRETRAWILWSDGTGGLVASDPVLVGGAGWMPAIGDLDGDGGDDVAWLDPSDGDGVIWWGASPHLGTEQRMLCGPFGDNSCVQLVPQVAIAGGPIVPMTIGDFDGNGADDLMARTTDNPPIIFSAIGGVGGGILEVGFHRSWVYGAVVGEFDGATTSTGQRLGDDLLLLFP